MSLFSIFKKVKKDDLFAIFPDGILVISTEGKILDINASGLAIFDKPKSEMVGSFFSLYIQGGSALLNKLVQNSVSAVAKTQNSEGEDVIVEISASKGEEERVYVAVRDITKNYKVQNMINGEYEIAKKIIDEKNSYLKRISGEMFSLLNSVVNFSKALNDGVVGTLTEKQNKYASIISKNSSELSYDLSRLFKYFEVESNLYAYEFKRFDLGDLLTSIAKKYEGIFEKKKMNFSYDFSSFVTRSCNSDPLAVEYFVKELLDISNKITDIGTVSMNVGNPPLDFLESKGFDVSDENIKKKYAMFEIRDSGLVLSQNVLDNVFDPYYLDEQMSKKMISAKMTFALVNKIVKDFKGDMWVYSKPGFGTLTCILFPMEKD